MQHRGRRPGVGRSGAPKRKRAGSQGRPKRRSTALLRRADIVEFVNQHAARIAAPDVAALMTDGALLREKATAIKGLRFQPFRRQIGEALDCLGDYFAGRCLQIPYHTIAVLAAALFYFRRPVDAVPDFFLEVGALDDALVMAVASEMAGEGLLRYRIWKSASREPRRPEPARRKGRSHREGGSTRR